MILRASHTSPMSPCAISCTAMLPSAVASIGPATTRQPVEEAAMRQARTQAPYYMKGLRGAAQLRRAACGLTVFRDAEELARLALQLNDG